MREHVILKIHLSFFSPKTGIIDADSGLVLNNEHFKRWQSFVGRSGIFLSSEITTQILIFKTMSNGSYFIVISELRMNFVWLS